MKKITQKHVQKYFYLFLFVLISIPVIYFSYNKLGSTSQFSEYSDVQNIITRGRLVIGTEPTYPPMEFISDEGTIEGIGIDVARKIASDLNVSLEIKQIPWEELFKAVESGDIDAAVSSITITPERSESFLFSEPYFVSGQSILVREDNLDIKNPQDLAGKKIAAYEDTTSYQEAVKYSQDKSLVQSYLGKIDKSVLLLTSGEIDAIIIDYPVGIDATNTFNKIKVVGKPFTSESYGIMTNKSNTGLVLAINDSLSLAKENGYLDKIISKWSE